MSTNEKLEVMMSTYEETATLSAQQAHCAKPAVLRRFFSVQPKRATSREATDSMIKPVLQEQLPGAFSGGGQNGIGA